MNIFYLSKDPELAAQYHCDKHVVKMIIEYAQLLSTAHRLVDGTPRRIQVGDKQKTIHLLKNERYRVTHTWVEKMVGDELIRRKKFRVEYSTGLYAVTHANHPCAVWARSSSAHYEWLLSLFVHLCSEYTHRYGKTHATSRLIEQLSLVPKKLKNDEWEQPPLAMPDEFKHELKPVKSYRLLYRGPKSRFAVWKKRDKPFWYDV